MWGRGMQQQQQHGNTRYNSFIPGMPPFPLGGMPTAGGRYTPIMGTPIGSPTQNHTRNTSNVGMSHSAWLAMYQAHAIQPHSNGIHVESSEVAHDYHRPKHDSGESDYSSGSSASCTSSSYTDNSDRMPDHNKAKAQNNRRRLSSTSTSRHHRRRISRHVKFASPGAENTKFDKVMRRVESVLHKPLYRDSEANEAETNVKAEMPIFYCPNCKTKQVSKFLSHVHIF